MLELFSRDWWVVAVRGLVALLIGIVILVWPGLTARVLLILFGILFLVDGAFSVFDASQRYQRREQWWPRLLRGLFGITAGVVTFVWPSVTAVVLLYIVAIWAITTGTLEIVAAIQLRREITGEALLVAAGILSVLVGLLLLADPMRGALALAVLIGVYFVVLGILLVLLGFQMQRVAAR